MAYTPTTIVSYTLNGTAKDFTIPFEYLARKFVTVTLVGEDRRTLVINDDFRFTGPSQITTNDQWGPGVGYTTIELRRVTSPTERLVKFSDGSILKAYDLNTSQIQAIHIAEEGRDISSQALINDSITWDALGLRIRNVGSPILPTDAANKQYADSLSASDRALTEQRISSTVRGPAGESLLTLPSASVRASKVMGFDANGNPIATLPQSGSANELAIILADPSQGATGVAYKHNLATASLTRTLAQKATETVSAAELKIYTNDNPSTTVAQINAALSELASIGGAPKELLFLDSSDWYFQDSPMIMRSGVSLIGRSGRKARFKNTRTVYDFFNSCCLLPGNFHPDFTEELAYKPVGTTQAGYSSVTLTNPLHAAGFASGDDVVVASDDYFLTGGTFKCPKYMILNEVVGVVGSTVYLKYPIDAAFVGGIVKLDGTQAGRNGVPLFFWKNGLISNLDFHTNGRLHGDTATLNCNFNDMHVRARSFIYGNTFQKTNWLRPSGLVGSGNEHSLCSLDCTVRDYDFTYDPTTEAAGGGTFFGFQENTRNFKYLGSGRVHLGGFTSGSALANFINAQDCGFIGSPRFYTGAGYTGSDIAFSTTTATGRLPCKDNIVDGAVFNGVSRFRYIDMSGDGGSSVDGNSVLNTKFRGTASSECLRYQGTTATNTVRNCELPTGRPLLAAGSYGLELVDSYIAAGLNSAADPDIYTRHVVKRIKTSGFVPRLNAERFLLNQISQSGTTPLSLLDGNVSTALSNRDTLAFEVRGNVSGTAGVKSIFLRINNNTDSISIPLLQKDFAAGTTGSFVIHGSLYIAQLSLMVSEMDVFTSTGSVREMLQSTSVVSIAGKDVSLQIVAACANAADGFSFQKFKCELTNPMLI